MSLLSSCSPRLAILQQRCLAQPRSVSCATGPISFVTQDPEYEEAFAYWTGALALHALRRCCELQELSLAWPLDRFTDEAVQALQVSVPTPRRHSESILRMSNFACSLASVCRTFLFASDLHLPSNISNRPAQPAC